ncbi:dTDP-glucose 4,6-dehydratase, partial [Nocardia sp. NPDC059228]
GNERTNRAITERLLEETGSGPEMIRHVADRKAHDLRYSIDDSKIRDELGYAPLTGFEEGLAATVDWYRDNVDWWKSVKYGAERAEG